MEQSQSRPARQKKQTQERYNPEGCSEDAGKDDGLSVSQSAQKKLKSKQESIQHGFLYVRFRHKPLEISIIRVIKLRFNRKQLTQQWEKKLADWERGPLRVRVHFWLCDKMFQLSLLETWRICLT